MVTAFPFILLYVAPPPPLSLPQTPIQTPIYYPYPSHYGLLRRCAPQVKIMVVNDRWSLNRRKKCNRAWAQRPTNSPVNQGHFLMIRYFGVVQVCVHSTMYLIWSISSAAERKVLPQTMNKFTWACCSSVINVLLPWFTRCVYPILSIPCYRSIPVGSVEVLRLLFFICFAPRHDILHVKVNWVFFVKKNQTNRTGLAFSTIILMGCTSWSRGKKTCHTQG